MPSPSALEPYTKCGARLKRGGICGQRAGARTDHEGAGKCWLHGGLTPIRSGRYSSIQREALRDLIARHEADPDPLNILPELAAARALFQDFVERYDEWRAALLAWHRSEIGNNRPMRPDKVAALKRILTDWEAERADEAGEDADDLPQQERELLQDARDVLDWLSEAPEGKPHDVLDVADAYRIVSEVTKIVERIERIRAANAVSRGDFLRVMTEMGRVVEAYVRDAATQQKIREGWLQIRVAA